MARLQKIETWKKLKLPNEGEIERIPLELLKKLIEECNRFLELSNKTLTSTASGYNKSSNQYTESNIGLDNRNISQYNIPNKTYEGDPYEVDSNITVPNLSTDYNQSVKPLDIMDRSRSTSNRGIYPTIPSTRPHNIPNESYYTFDKSGDSSNEVNVYKGNEGIKEKETEDPELERLVQEVINKSNKEVYLEE